MIVITDFMWSTVPAGGDNNLRGIPRCFFFFCKTPASGICVVA